MHRLITEGFHVKPDGWDICNDCGIYQETDRFDQKTGRHVKETESGDKYVQLCGGCAQAGPPKNREDFPSRRSLS